MELGGIRQYKLRHHTGFHRIAAGQRKKPVSRCSICFSRIALHSIRATPLLHLRASSDAAWIADFTQQAVAQRHARLPGVEALLARLTEVMLVRPLRRD